VSGAEDRFDLSWLAVVDEIRAALAGASRREVADRVPAGLPARFVADGRWALGEAVERVRRVNKPQARVAALVELACSVEGSAAERLWIEAICVAATTQFSPINEWRLLAPRLPAALHARALEAVAGIRDLGHRLFALGELLPHLPGDLVPDAFAVVMGVGRAQRAQAGPSEPPVPFIDRLPGDELPDVQVWLAEGLCQVAGRLPRDLVRDAFDLADAVTFREGRANALLCLSVYLPVGWAGQLSPERRRELVAELAAARGRGLLEDESQDLCWQELFTELLPDELFADAVAVAGAIDAQDGAFMLAGLAPRLPVKLLERARSVAESLPAEPRARALVGILPHLLDDARLAGLAGLLADVASRADEEPPPWVRRSFRPYTASHVRRGDPLIEALPDLITGGHLDATASRPDESPTPLTDTWAAVSALADGWPRDYLVVRLCPRLPDELLPEAVARLTGILAADEYDSELAARGLVALAPRLDEPLLAQAWEAGVAIRDPDARDLALAHLAPYLPGRLIPRALDDAGRLPLRSSFGKHVRYAVLRAIAPRVPDPLIAKAVDALVPVWLDPIYDHDRIGEAGDILAGLVNRLSAPQRHDMAERALSVAAGLDGRATRAQALARVATLLPADLIPAALAAAAGVSSIDGDAEAQRAVMGNATTVRLGPDTTLTSIPDVETLVAIGGADHGDLAEVLGALASSAPIDLLLAMYAAMTRINDAEEMAAVRAKLASEGQGGAGQAAAGSADAGTVATAVATTGWDPLTIATMLPIEWSWARRQVEQALPLPATPLPTVVNRFAAMQITEYPEEAKAWALAGLAPHLAPDLMPGCLAMAATIKDPYDRGGALVGLAPYLPDHLRAEALDLARTLPDDYRMWTMAGFAPWLPDEERQRLITEVRDGMKGTRQTRTLARLGPWLPDDLIVYALMGTRSIEQPATGSRNVASSEHANADVAQDRANVVAALVHAIPPERRDPTLAAVLLRMAPYALLSIVSDLQPYLPDPLPPELGQAVMVLLEHRNHGTSIRPLIDRLPAVLLPLALTVVDPSAPAAIAAILRRAHALLAASAPVRLAELICQGLRIPQQTRADCLIVVEAAIRSLATLGPRPAIDACAVVFDEASARWP
jgi:hypothetical protein